MLPEASKIKEMRKERGLTQHQLADLSGVSQSFIARIEKGDVDPSYSKMTRILSALKNVGKSMSAKELMTKRVITISPGDEIRKAALKMKNLGISQLPVVKSDKVLGTISEKEIAFALSEGSKARTVEDIMSRPLPIVDENSNVKMLSSILEHAPALLVSRNGKIAGIITRADLLRLA